MSVETFTLGPVPGPRSTAVATLSELNAHPGLYFEGSDIVMMLLSSAQVFLMIPGISLVYSGAADRYSAITMARIPLILTAFLGIEWYLWGYTLTFSPSAKSNDAGTFSWYGGDTRSNAFTEFSTRPVGIQGGPSIPELVFALYQGMFACFTASIVAGAVMRKTPIGRFLVFISIWSVVVYSPIARWTWHPQGWSRMRGAMDFAGGTAVHICSGATVAAYSLFFQLQVRGWKDPRNMWSRWWRESRESKIGAATRLAESSNGDNTRRTPTPNPLPDGGILAPGSANGEAPNTARPADLNAVPTPEGGVTDAAGATQQTNGAPTSKKNLRERKLDLEMQHLEDSENHNVTSIVLGTTLLWFGWFGFNGGSAQGANLRAVSAVLATHVAACAGGSVGLLLEWLIVLPSQFLLKDTKKSSQSVLGFCDGAIAGLVAITPAAGYVPVKVASVFGVIACIFCKWLRYYVRKRILPYDILDICAIHAGGGLVGMLLCAAFADDVVTGLDGHSQLASKSGAQRLRNQLLDVSAGFFYSFFATFTILVFMELVIKCLRPMRKWLKSKIHKRLLESNSGYRRRYEKRSDSVEADDEPWRPNVVRDKLIAVPQHVLLENQGSHA